VLAMMNVRFLVSRRRLESERLQGSPFVFREDIPGFSVYENPSALDRFWLVGRVQPARSEAEALAMLRSRNFRPAEVAIVEGAVDLPPGPAAGVVRIRRYGLKEVELEVETPRAQFLASSESHYPGWRAWIDGRAQRIHYTNLAFRGLVVPAGRHTVRMEFVPALLGWSAAVSAAAWLLWAGLLWRTARHRPVAPGQP
ncbi:MAG: YfhO family protein, partial [Acidobacteria bacterium]|nr:YfhO family protein [Acidobacteriota bacterium]